MQRVTSQYQGGTWKKSRKLTGDRETAKAPFLLQGLGFTNSGALADDNRIIDKAVFVSLDLPDHGGLRVGRAVVVNDTQTTLQSHMNGHFMLGDGVHGRRNEGRLQDDVLGNGRIERDLRGSKANVARQDEEVIVRQTTASLCVHQLLNGEPISGLILLEELDGLGVVEEVRLAVHGGVAVGGRHRGVVRPTI